MEDIITNAQNIKTLNPNADNDPFTHQPLSPQTSIESLVRAHKTKAVTDTVAAAAAAEISGAQQSARDAVGADTGCTHNLENQAKSPATSLCSTIRVYTGHATRCAPARGWLYRWSELVVRFGLVARFGGGYIGGPNSWSDSDRPAGPISSLTPSPQRPTPRRAAAAPPVAAYSTLSRMRRGFCSRIRSRSRERIAGFWERCAGFLGAVGSGLRVFWERLRFFLRAVCGFFFLSDSLAGANGSCNSRNVPQYAVLSRNEPQRAAISRNSRVQPQ